MQAASPRTTAGSLSIESARTFLNTVRNFYGAFNIPANDEAVALWRAKLEGVGVTDENVGEVGKRLCDVWQGDWPTLNKVVRWIKLNGVTRGQRPVFMEERCDLCGNSGLLGVVCPVKQKERGYDFGCQAFNPPEPYAGAVVCRLVLPCTCLAGESVIDREYGGKFQADEEALRDKCARWLLAAKVGVGRALSEYTTACAESARAAGKGRIWEQRDVVEGKVPF